MCLRKFIAFVILFSFLLSSAMGKDCLIAGKWKSNESKTLANMAKTDLTEKQRKLLSSMFGRLIFVDTCEGSTSYFDGEVDVIKFISIKEEGNTVVTEYYDKMIDKVVKRKVIISGDCYSIEIEGLGFSEVFCREE